MRPLILGVIPALLLPLAACGGGDGGNNASDGAPGNGADAAPIGNPTAPPPKTPVLDVEGAPGNQAGWMEPKPGGGDPTSAPYGNLLDQPLVNGASNPG